METMTVKAAAERLGVHENTVRAWTRSGMLGYVSRGSHRRPTVESVEAAVEQVSAHNALPPRRRGARVEMVPVAAIEDVLPERCVIFDSGDLCTELVGHPFESGAAWTEEMCCLPCRIRRACREGSARQ